MTTLDDLQADADAISTASPNTRKFAQDTVAYLRSLAPAPPPTPTPPPVVFGSAVAAFLPRQARPTTAPKLVPAGSNLDTLLAATPSTGDVIYQLLSGSYAAALSRRKFTAPVWIEPAPGALPRYTGPTHGLYLDGCQRLVFVDAHAYGCGNTGIKVDASSADVEFIRPYVETNANLGFHVASSCARIMLRDARGWMNGSVEYAGAQANQCHNFYFGSVSKLLIANLLSTVAPFGSCLQLGGSVTDALVTGFTLDGATAQYGDGLEVYTMGTQLPQNLGIDIRNGLTTNHRYYGVQGSGTNPNRASVRLHDVLAYGNGAGAFFAGGQFADGTAVLTGDPRYVDRAHGDYHLQADSPAIGKGDPAYMPAYDIEGKPRVRPALGAFAA